MVLTLLTPELRPAFGMTEFSSKAQACGPGQGGSAQPGCGQGPRAKTLGGGTSTCSWPHCTDGYSENTSLTPSSSGPARRSGSEVWPQRPYHITGSLNKKDALLPRTPVFQPSYQNRKLLDKGLVLQVGARRAFLKMVTDQPPKLQWFQRCFVDSALLLLTWDLVKYGSRHLAMFLSADEESPLENAEMHSPESSSKSVQRVQGVTREPPGCLAGLLTMNNSGPH